MPISRSSVGRQETARDRVPLAPPGQERRLGEPEKEEEEEELVIIQHEHKATDKLLFF